MNWTSAMNGWDERDARLTVKARELRPGDYLIGSRRTVDYVEVLRGSRVRVDTTTTTGERLSGTWNAATAIGVRRREVTA